MKQSSHPADAVLALLVPHRIVSVDWNGILWEDVVKVASAHLVLPALAEPTGRLSHHVAVPTEFLDFLISMEHSNRARNRALYDALVAIATMLGEQGITSVALKGAAFLIDHPQSAAAWRFMSDLDLLIEAEHLASAVEVLQRLGYRAAKDTYDPGRVAHYPPLISPCGRFSVELHTRIFAFGAYGLPNQIIRAGMLETGIPGLTVPGLVHRIVHVLAHAQLHNRNHPIYRIVLKDFLDLSRLLACSQVPDHCWTEVAACFTKPDERRRAMALAAAWHQAIQPETPNNLVSGTAELAWAELALARLGRSAQRARSDALFDTIRVEVQRMRCERGHFAHRCRQLANPAELLSSAGAFSHKMRHRLWR